METDNIKITPKWIKSKEEIWATVFEEQENAPQMPVSRKRVTWFYAAAAIVAIVVMLPSIAFFYTKSEVAERGTHLAVVLPDGSKVTLNAESEISYKPIWWFISREAKLKGEAYFEVEKGSTFDVRSGQYTVSVLGTSFNILSRIDKFSVTCLTGKVSVAAKSELVTLTPNMQASWSNGKLIAAEMNDAQESINWKQGKFVFVSVPLQEVIREIERQYNIEVIPSLVPDHSYSGNFTKTNNPDDVLRIVGTPFGIEFKRK